ncbi:MAG TPA: DNA polymerase III subunit delta [Bacteroidales bacterium]|nr:DNA polymerase III subunit delta [Bacteroidales bacterium]
MYFRDIPGHQEIKRRLIHSVAEERISHAQMLHGPEGCGNLALALAYARYISCTNKGPDDACGTCPSCIKYNKLAHPDLHFVFPAPSTTTGNDAASDGLLDKWREALIENPYMNQYQWYERIGMENKQGLIGTKESSAIIRKLSLKSYESEYKILIMWLPERMNTTSANKLLKLIEEPPAGTVFLLVSETPEDVLPTIQSRTQPVKISRMSDKAIGEGLQTLFPDGGEIIHDAVRLANGNYNKALTAVRADEQNKYNFEKFVSLMRLCYGKRVAELIGWAEEVSGIGREKQKMLLVYAMRLVRENFMLNLGEKDITYMAAYENDFSTKFSRFIHRENVYGIYDELNLAYNHIAANAYARIVLLDLSLKIISLLHK